MPERLLLVSLDNLGDLVFSSALLPPLRERYPGVAIDVWCKAYTADVARLLPGVRTVIASDPFWDRAPGRGKGRIFPFLHAMRRVRAGGYDAALLGAAPWRTAAAVALTGIPMRIGFERRRNARFLTHAVAAEDITRPVLAEMARLLIPLDVGAPQLRYCLERAPLATRVSRLASRMPERFVALHPFASKRDRCVPVDEWRAVAMALEATGLSPLWIGSPRELAELRESPSPSTWRFIDEVGDGSLADSAAALSMATLFAGHDSGPLHIAGAFGVPVLGVFAPGEPLRTFPQGVGLSRMLARRSPAEISAHDILAELETLRAAAGV